MPLSLRRSSRSLALVFAIAMVSGCSGSSDSEDENDNAAITAENANASQHALKERVLAGFAASSESAKALGITSWDAFAGTDDKTGFSGSVFYASDANGDVKYVVSVDVIKKVTALLELTQEGQPSDRAINPETAAALTSELERLKTQLATAPTRGAVGGSLYCAGAIALSALDLLDRGGSAALVGTVVYAGAVAALLVGGAAIGYLEAFGADKSLMLPVLYAAVGWAAVGQRVGTVAFSIAKQSYDDSLLRTGSCVKLAPSARE